MLITANSKYVMSQKRFNRNLRDLYHRKQQFVTKVCLKKARIYGPTGGYRRKEWINESANHH